MRRCGVVLEFQITSNVRLNNLSQLEHHPLRQYLKAGVLCVQGTDGGALYGTNSIDEELSLEKLLGLTHGELLAMRRAEDAVLEQSRRVFDEKREAFYRACPGDAEQYYRAKLERKAPLPKALWQGSGKLDAEEGLKGRIAPLPENRFPIVVAGGSFNNSQHRTPLRAEDRAFIDALLHRLDGDKYYFVVGHTLSGPEGYLARQAKGRFPVFAIVPSQITRAERARLLAAGVGVRVSIESSGMGLYKSFAYEIFKRMPSALLAFDGNFAALNLIQEARNGRKKCRIYIHPKSRGLAVKARLLEGYVRPLEDAEAIAEELGR